LIGGGYVGAQYQWGNWVLGVEGTFSAMKLNQTQPSVVIGGGRTRSLRIDGIATVVGRVGYAWNNWLPYVKGGWADSRINTSSTDPNLGGNNSSTTQRFNGWTIGGGADYMVVHNWIVGVDFNYYNVTFNHTFSFVPGGLPGAITNSQANVYAATVRLTYLFNGSGPSMWTY
jgi:outer membrane immunogenic protein